MIPVPQPDATTHDAPVPPAPTAELRPDEAGSAVPVSPRAATDPAPQGDEPQGPALPGTDIVRRRDAYARLGDDIAELAARIQAATYELLVMLREFDAQQGWAGFPSCAHWLHWRTGLAPGAAREKVRVARALGGLPLLAAAMRRGQLSYSKVRALTRVATPASEARLLDCARCATAAQVERLTRAWQRVDRQAEADVDRQRHEGRELQTWVDDDGMVVVRGRLTPEVGAVVRQALEAAADRLQAEVSPDDAAETSTGQRRADALGLVAESALAGGLDRGTAGDRYQVVLHVESEALQAVRPAGASDDGGCRPATASDATAPEEAGAVRVSAETPRKSDTEAGAAAAARAQPALPAAQAALEDADGLRVSAETSRRLACDAALVVMRHAQDAAVLDVGRRTRTVPPALRRALEARDRRCRFPGCQERRCDSHHVEHWADGGATKLSNLVRLCRPPRNSYKLFI